VETARVTADLCGSGVLNVVSRCHKVVYHLALAVWVHLAIFRHHNRSNHTTVARPVRPDRDLLE
jgi:hypothetical protein